MFSPVCSDLRTCHQNVGHRFFLTNTCPAQGTICNTYVADPPSYKHCRLEVQLRNKKCKSIPIHLTQNYYNEGFSPSLENIKENDEFITMERVLQELLRQLHVEHVVWTSDKMGNYFQVTFPLPTGDICETMLHCLTQLGIGVRCKSIVNVLPCNVVHSAIDKDQSDSDTLFRKNEEAKRWRSFVESIRSKLTVRQVVDGVRVGGELSFDYLTLIITAEGNVRSLWMGVLWALTSGTGVALALLQGSAGPLIGIAISASLLPPVVNCGLFWALACIWLLYPGTKIPHIKGEPYFGNSTYVPLYHSYIPIEFAVNGIVSCCLTIVNVICIFITAIMFLKIKEVAAPYTSTPDLRRFWEQDIKVARDANRAHLHRAEDDERIELVLEDLNDTTDPETKEKLEAAVKEALDDETYRKVKRMSYQSHNADEVIRTIGLQPYSPSSRCSSMINTGMNTPMQTTQSGNVNDIEALDKLLTSLLGLRENRGRSFRSHKGTPTISRVSSLLGSRKNNRYSESWPERILHENIVQNVVTNLKSKRNSPVEEPFLTPK